MAPITNQPLLQAEATLAAETNKRVVNRSIPTAIAKQAEGWRTGRTGAGRTRERPCARSTKKQWGASARIAHHGRAPSTDAAVRGRIYVSSRTSSPKNGVLATGEGSIYGRSTSLTTPKQTFASLFDDLSRPNQKRIGNLDAKGRRRFFIDHQFQLRYLFDRQICEFYALQNHGRLPRHI